jgi:hypothetical protein
MADIKKYLHNLDVVNNKVMNLLLNPLTTVQRTAIGGTLGVSEKGYVCYDTDLNQQYFWNGSAWIVVGGSATWGSIAGTITAQTDLTAYLAANYYPLLSNPAGYLTLATLPPVITSNLQQVVNAGNGISNFGGIGNASIQSTNFTNGRTLYLNDNAYPTIRLVDNANASNFLQIDLDTLNIDGTSYNWSSIVNQGTVTGSGTTNYIPKWTPTGTALGDSQIFDDGTYVRVGIGGGSMGFPYEKLILEAPQDMKFGAYTSVAAPNLGGASYVLGYTNFLTTAGYYPGFEFQMSGAATDADNFIRYNFLQRNAAGIVVANNSNIFNIYADNRISFKKLIGTGTEMVVADASGFISRQAIPTAGTLVALPFTTDHLATTNNEYVIGDVVWYAGNVYGCIANNDSLQPNLAPAYWTLIGAGFPLVQQPADWNSTTGNNQILNKPTIPTVGTWGALNYPTWVSGTPFVKMTAVGTFALDTTSYQPLLTNPVTGTGTATRVAFWDTGSSISSDADLYWDNVNKRLGIGTATPTYKLDLVNTDATPFYARFTNQDGSNKNAITFGKSTSAAMAMSDSNGVVKILIGDGSTGFANFITYNDNVFNFSYSNALGGAQLPSSLVKFTPNFTYSTGTNSHTILDINPNINVSGGTNTLRGVYYNPNNTAGTVTTEIAWENTQGDIIHRNLATGGADEMITVDTNGKLKKQAIPSGGGGTVTSVDLTMPVAFNVTGNPITTNGTIAVTGAGTVSQYVRGDGTLANFPNSTGGGSSVNYYLNGSISQGTFGGDTYYEMSKTPVLGAGTNFTRTNGAGNGYIASFITDANDPSQLNIPGGNWNVEFYFQSSASGGTPSFYAELYKVSASNVFTLIASGSANPEGITNGTVVDQYFTSIPVPQTSLLIDDRLAIRIFVTTGGRTLTLHTENGNLCEVLTTLTTGLTALNGLTAQVQNFADDTNVQMVSSGSTHTITWAGTLADSRIASASTWNSKQNSRSVNVVSTNTNAGSAASTDYVYLVSGTTTITLPTAVGNTNRYTIKRSGTGVVSIATTSSQTIDDSASPITINVQYVSIDLISNGTNWEII